jgi:hypothetical protein
VARRHVPAADLHRRGRQLVGGENPRRRHRPLGGDERQVHAAVLAQAGRRRRAGEAGHEGVHFGGLLQGRVAEGGELFHADLLWPAGHRIMAWPVRTQKSARPGIAY